MVSTDANRTCRLIAKRPKRNATEESQKWTTSDYETMVRFSGYLKYNLDRTSPNRRNVFLPLQVKSIHTYRSNSTRRIVTLFTDCAEIDLVVDQKADKTKLLKVNIRLGIPNRKYRACTVWQDNVYSTNSRHIRLAKVETFECRDPAGAQRKLEHETTTPSYNYNYRSSPTPTEVEIEAEIVAKLYIFRLEFEVDGNHNILEKGNFSTSAGFLGETIDSPDDE